MESNTDNTSAATSGDRQIVALRLAGELYGIDIAHIHTVITPQAITSVPRSPSFVRGVINLRGRIVPVVDLRRRFDLPPLDAQAERDSRIVIIETDGLTAGLVVDGVSEVLRLSHDSIDPPSHLVSSRESTCVIGIGKISNGKSTVDRRRTRGAETEPDERLIVLLDVRKIFDQTLMDRTGAIPAVKAA